LCLKPLLLVKPLNSDPRKAGSWTGHEDQVSDVEKDLHQVRFGTKQFSIIRGVHARESYEKPEQYE